MGKSPLSILSKKELSLPEKEPPPLRNDDSVPAMLADLNRIIHEPAGLAILTVLSTCVMRRLQVPSDSHGALQGQPFRSAQPAGRGGTDSQSESDRTQTHPYHGGSY
jgi:hypothetical protein